MRLKEILYLDSRAIQSLPGASSASVSVGYTAQSVSQSLDGWWALPEEAAAPVEKANANNDFVGLSQN